jgi:hypothetical protein
MKCDMFPLAQFSNLQVFLFLYHTGTMTIRILGLCSIGHEMFPFWTHVIRTIFFHETITNRNVTSEHQALTL